MNLRQMLDEKVIYAGGPGSGRHALIEYNASRGHTVVAKDLSKEEGRNRLALYKDSAKRTRKLIGKTSPSKYNLLEHTPGEKDSVIAERANAKWGRWR